MTIEEARSILDPDLANIDDETLRHLISLIDALCIYTINNEEME